MAGAQEVVRAADIVCTDSEQRDEMPAKNINCLEDSVLKKIFSYLKAEDLVTTIRYVCPYWRKLIYTDDLWEQVSFCPPGYMSDKEVIKFIRHMPRIKSITILHSRDIETLMDALCACCWDVRKIIVRCKASLNHAMIRRTLKTFPNLTTFEVMISGSKLYLDYAKAYAKQLRARTLKTIQRSRDFSINKTVSRRRCILQCIIITCKMTSQMFKILCTVKYLKLLFVYNIDKDVFSIDIKPLENLQHLESLQLVHFKNSRWCKSASVLTGNVLFLKLTKLEIIDAGPMVSSAVNYLLRRCPNLKLLNLQENNFTDSLLEDVSFCKDLEYLDVSNNGQLTNRFIENIADNCRKLNFLDISNCSLMTDKFILILQTCRDLEVLHLEGSNFMGLYFHCIPFLYPKLAELNVKHFECMFVIYDIKMEMPHLRVKNCTCMQDEKIGLKFDDVLLA
ncbi:F-box and leucine-rich repeat protein 13-like [Periplaneta americana]|uniref:F-box and leucine-rich repeat protein 13-like n=1 Tax=Periplaneta americana TaxID=6978 RepID=UPI0037E71941